MLEEILFKVEGKKNSVRGQFSLLPGPRRATGVERGAPQKDEFRPRSRKRRGELILGRMAFIRGGKRGLEFVKACMAMPRPIGR